MIVARGMQRRMTAHELYMLVDRFEPAAPQARALGILEQRGARAAEELPCNRPIDQPDRHLERTRPVGTHAVWTRGKPAFQVLPQNMKISCIAAKRISLRQRHEMQMPV